MIIDNLSFRMAEYSDRDVLSSLWQEAFGDEESFFSLFFDKGFSPQRSALAVIDGRIASALYWFDFSVDEEPIAYIYGVATFKEYRGRGIASALLENAAGIISRSGYSGIILVPAKPHLYSYYEKNGYKIATKVSIITAKPSNTPASLRIISIEEYMRLRASYLPKHSIGIHGDGLDFMAGQYVLAAGDDFVCAFYKDEERLVCRELLGNTHAASGITSALGCKEGEFRTVGDDKPFAMLLPFKELPQPAYLAIAFD